MDKGVEIKVFVILNALGLVVGLRLNRASADDMLLDYPGGRVEPHLAHKRRTRTYTGSGEKT